MKTDDLIRLLAADTAPVDRRGVPESIAVAAGVGIALAAALMLAALGVRSDLAQAIAGPMFWAKVVFASTVAAASLATLARLARPGADASAGAVAIGAPIMLLWLLASAAYATAQPPERAALVWGQTWQVCTLTIAAVSVPILAAVFVAVRRLAPTRLALAGACAGTLSGAAGAAVYAFHCPETALPFLAIWYVAGIVLTALLGAVLGPRVLKW